MHIQSIYSSAVITLVELSKSLSDDIEESWNTKRALGDQAGRESEADAVAGRSDDHGDNNGAPHPDSGEDIEEVLRTAA